MYTYQVYQIDELDYGSGVEHRHKTLLGTTRAPSEKKAIANIIYRLKIRKDDLYCPYTEGGRRISYLIATKI